MSKNTGLDAVAKLFAAAFVGALEFANKQVEAEQKKAPNQRGIDYHWIQKFKMIGWEISRYETPCPYEAFTAKRRQSNEVRYTHSHTDIQILFEMCEKQTQSIAIQSDVERFAALGFVLKCEKGQFNASAVLHGSYRCFEGKSLETLYAVCSNAKDGFFDPKYYGLYEKEVAKNERLERELKATTERAYSLQNKLNCVLNTLGCYC